MKKLSIWIKHKYLKVLLNLPNYLGKSSNESGLSYHICLHVRHQTFIGFRSFSTVVESPRSQHSADHFSRQSVDWQKNKYLLCSILNVINYSRKEFQLSLYARVPTAILVRTQTTRISHCDLACVHKRFILINDIPIT